MLQDLPLNTLQMMRMNRKQLTATLLFIFSASIVCAQEIIISDAPPEPETSAINRILGDQYINIALGLQIPLFIHDPAASSGTAAVQPINLNPGGIFSLGWSVFLENSFSLGWISAHRTVTIRI